MADNSTKIVISAEDKTTAAFASAKAGLEKFSAAYSALGGIAGIGIATGIATSVKATIDLADSINDLSQRVGISVKDLATWELAATQSGTSLESVARGVKGLSTFMVENSGELKKAGITATEANGALIQLADLFAAMPDGVEKTALAVKLFGKAGMDMIPMLNQGSAGLQEAADKAKAYGERMAAMAPNADKFNDQVAELALNSKILGMNIADYVLPGLIGMSQWLNDLAAGGDRAATALEFLSERSPLVYGLVKLHDLLGGGESRSKGFSGEKNTLGLPIGAAEKALAELKAFDAATQSYMEQREAKGRALGLLGKGSKDAKAGKAPAVGGVEDYESRIKQAVSGAITGSAVVKSRELADQIAVLDKLFFNSGLEADVYASALERLTKMTASASDESAQLNRLLDATPTAQLEKARDDMQLLLKTFYDAQGILKDGMSEDLFIEAAQTRLGQLGEQVKEVDNFARDMGLTFASAFEDAVIGGKSFSDVLKGLAQDIERIILRKTITEPLGNAVSESIKSGGGLFGDIKSLFGFASGGSFTVGGGGGTDSQLVAFRATPGEQVSIATPSQQRGGGITVNIVEDSTRAGQTQQRQGGGGGNVLDVFVDRIRSAVATDIARGSGPIPAAMSMTYGLNRAAGAY